MQAEVQQIQQKFSPKNDFLQCFLTFSEHLLLQNIKEMEGRIIKSLPNSLLEFFLRKHLL